MKPFVPLGYVELRGAVTVVAQRWFKDEMDVVKQMAAKYHASPKGDKKANESR